MIKFIKSEHDYSIVNAKICGFPLSGASFELKRHPSPLKACHKRRGATHYGNSMKGLQGIGNDE